MADSNALGPWIRQFLMQHLVGVRNLSVNTQTSYRDTLVQLLPFAAAKASIFIDKLTVDHLSSETVRLFLLHLEETRKCSISTRNQRLAAIHALARFIGSRGPEHISWCTDVCSIPFKKGPQPTIGYLEKHELDALLDAPDRSCGQGKRDYALLLFLYNTGARASEAAQVTISDLELGRFSAVRIVGKGNKVRHCPLWLLTCRTLQPLIASRPASERVFLNRQGQPITRFGIHALVKRTVSKAAPLVPSLRGKQISVHSIRHTTAVHLLRAGVDVNTIRDWLGHVSLATTNVYARVDLEMKARALAHCEILSPALERNWHEDPELMSFLKSL